MCFLESTKILCEGDQNIPIECIKPGTLVKTYNGKYIPVKYINKTKIYNSGNNIRSPNRLYVCSKKYYAGIGDDLVITGHQSILVDNLTPNEIIKIKRNGSLCLVDDLLGLPCYIDIKTIPLPLEGTFTIWNLALCAHDNDINFGIYANGLLVESATIEEFSLNYIKE
jgi:hypothetical protein